MTGAQPANWTASGPLQAAEAPVSPASESAAGSDFDALVLAQQPYVTRLAHRLLAWDDDIADVVQDVFLAAYRHWPAFRNEAKVTTWLASITLNACRTHRRRRWLRLRWAARTERIPEPVSDEALTENLERNTAVRLAIAALPQRYREVVVLRYLQGFAIEEIALMLGRSRVAIDSQLSRGRTMLRQRLREWMDD